MNIVEWSDEDYGSQKRRKKRQKKLIQKGKPADRMAHQLLMMRQRQFYSDCVVSFKRQGLSWVFLTDTDEYVVFNQVHEDDPTKMEEIGFARDILAKDNSTSATIKWEDMDPFQKERIKQSVQKVKKVEKDSFDSVGEGYLTLRQRLPDIGEQTVMDYIQRVKLQRDQQQYRDDSTTLLSLFEDDPCHIMPRLFHSSIEPSSEEISRVTVNVDKNENENIDDVLNPMNFDTLRYLHSVPKGAYDYNTFGKTALDVSHISEDDLTKFRGVHRPIELCRKAYTDVYYSQALLRVNHYLGSWEAYSAKADKRRTREKYDERSGLSAGVMYDAQPWLSAFVKNVGLKNARYLLQGVGDYSELSKVYAEAGSGDI